MTTVVLTEWCSVKILEYSTWNFKVTAKAGLGQLHSERARSTGASPGRAQGRALAAHRGEPWQRSAPGSAAGPGHASALADWSREAHDQVHDFGHDEQGSALPGGTKASEKLC